MVLNYAWSRRWRWWKRQTSGGLLFLLWQGRSRTSTTSRPTGKRSKLQNRYHQLKFFKTTLKSISYLLFNLALKGPQLLTEMASALLLLGLAGALTVTRYQPHTKTIEPCLEQEVEMVEETDFWRTPFSSSAGSVYNFHYWKEIKIA